MEQLSATEVKDILDSVTSPRIHLMVDLETLSTKPTAAIRELGWAFFDMNHTPGRMISSGSVFIDPQPMLDSPVFHKDWKTISWWMLRKQPVLEIFAGPVGIPLAEALSGFSKTVRETPIHGVWAHGASFDIPILQNAYSFAGLDVPWEYRIVRDTRTIFDLARPVETENVLLHSARHDAVAQATDIQAAVQLIKRKMSTP